MYTESQKIKPEYETLSFGFIWLINLVNAPKNLTKNHNKKNLNYNKKLKTIIKSICVIIF